MTQDISALLAELKALPTGREFTKRDERYFNRLVARADLLRVRLSDSSLRDTQEIEQELHALDWAIARLSNELLPAAAIARSTKA